MYNQQLGTALKDNINTDQKHIATVIYQFQVIQKFLSKRKLNPQSKQIFLQSSSTNIYIYCIIYIYTHIVLLMHMVAA